MGELAIDQWDRGTHSRGQPTASNSQLCKRPRMESQSKIASQWSNLFTQFLRQASSNNFPKTLEGKISGEIVWTNKIRVGNPEKWKLIPKFSFSHIDLMRHVNIKQNHLIKIRQQANKEIQLIMEYFEKMSKLILEWNKGNNAVVWFGLWNVWDWESWVQRLCAGAE